jgi:hypothetical protein
MVLLVGTGRFWFFATRNKLHGRLVLFLGVALEICAVCSSCYRELQSSAEAFSAACEDTLRSPVGSQVVTTGRGMV